MVIEPKGVDRDELDAFLRDVLAVDGYVDYGPNGLQIEGRERIHRIGFAVSATRDSVLAAVERGADALVVHHGLFWDFSGVRPLTGTLARRVFPLVRGGVNLFSYHLPLDAHPKLGNAAGLARQLDAKDLLPFGDYKGRPTGLKGVLARPMNALELRDLLEARLRHPVLLASFDEAAIIKTVGIITGGANKDWRLAVSAGLDAYLTGEMSEHDWHESQEAGIHMFAAGHHATEVFGVQSLMRLLSEKFDLDCFYIDSKNPA